MHIIFTTFRDLNTREWSANILLPGKQEAEKLEGYEDREELLADLHARYGETAERVSIRAFGEELERRTTHSAEMLEFLKETWAGDLRGWHVYASISRPMMGIRIEGTVFLTPPKGAHTSRPSYEIYDYVCSKEPLDARTLEHFTLVPISHPAAANQG